VLTRPNKKSIAKVDAKVLKPVPVPTGISGIEGNYTDALFEAYGQEAGIDGFSEAMLNTYPKYKENFSRQRTYYFAAETVRRGTRDMYGDREKDQFEILKEEMFEGVIEVWEEEYKNGLSRMRNVMAQATKIALAKCKICRDTDWVGNSQRKGVCHFLVGEKKLKGWVRDDDDQAI
jgi:hypothetical protein